MIQWDECQEGREKIITNGNVGIGTTSPIVKFQVDAPASGETFRFNGTANQWTGRIYGSLTADQSYGLIVHAGTSASDIGFDVTGAGGSPTFFRINGDGKVGINTSTPAGMLHVVTNGVNALVVQNVTGNVGIGTTGPNLKLDVEDDIQIGTGTTGCVKDADNTTLVGTCVSDVRLKKDIKSLSPVLDRLATLQPVTFRWKQDGNATEYGLIAQEVQKIMPELVTEDDKGYLRVSYDTKLFMVMLQSIKELKSENDVLKSENLNMKADIKVLSKDIQKLKNSVNRGG